MQKQSIAYSTENVVEDNKYLDEKIFDSDMEQNEFKKDESVLSDAIENVSKKRVISIGAVFDDYTNSTGSITSMENLLGIKYSTISIFKQFGHQHNKDINISDLAFIRESGKNLMISWEPWNPDEGLQQSKDYLVEIVNGSQDDYINNFASSIKDYNSPVIIRFAHEMNGNWYPWGNSSDKYKNAYRYIHDKFIQLDISNVKWMWSINNESVPYENISSASKYYPGNKYVDIVGVDGFNFGTVKVESSWRSFEDTFSDAYNFLISTYDKKIVFSEVASAEQGGDKSVWVNDMFDSLNKRFTSVEEIVWFNLIKETDWRFDSTQSSLEAFKNNLQ
jgi:beta-mannanase